MLAPNPTVQALQAARNLIADETKWCRRYLAQDTNGECALDLSDAAAWCAHGAIMRDSGFRYAPAARLIDRVAGEMFAETVREHPEVIPAAAVNDYLGHAAVLALFQRAIELAAAPADLALDDPREAS